MRSLPKYLSFLIVLCFLSASLVPAGFMPGQGKSGYSITICSGAETKNIFVTDAPSHEKNDKVNACPFALAASYTKPTSVSFTFEPVIVALINTEITGSELIISQILKSYFSQGPPVAV